MTMPGRQRNHAREGSPLPASQRTATQESPSVTPGPAFAPTSSGTLSRAQRDFVHEPARTRAPSLPSGPAGVDATLAPPVWSPAQKKGP
jgi:hypothetical protein